MLAAVLLAGLASGPSSLASAAASDPPIGWGSLTVFFLGALISLPLVLGFQVALGNIKALRFGWLFFLFGAVDCTASGLAALVAAATGPGLLPHSFLFLSVGLAMLVGLGIVKILFAGKFANGI